MGYYQYPDGNSIHIIVLQPADCYPNPYSNRFSNPYFNCNSNLNGYR
jgi:hypothetical protein